MELYNILGLYQYAERSNAKKLPNNSSENSDRRKMYANIILKLIEKRLRPFNSIYSGTELRVRNKMIFSIRFVRCAATCVHFLFKV